MSAFTEYYELRAKVSRIIPRLTQLWREKKHADAVREKGRKSGYKEFKLSQGQFVPQERLLNLQEVNSFVEISCRAAACPMPLNLDVWDGLLCPYGCKYCFANSFRASLYTAFFDNSKTMGLRHCNPTMYKEELDKLMKSRGKDPHSIKSDVAKAIATDTPIRFGIRFEDFVDEEREAGISLQLLEYLKEQAYPVMINTKSTLVSEDAYVRALSENPGKAAVHITLISSNNRLLKQMEPGAPSYRARLKAMKALTQAGVRVVARIEPYLVFVNDNPFEVEQYIEDIKGAGVKNITFDTYSYTAHNPGIKQSFMNDGLDWDRIFTLGADSQALGSLLLGSFMGIFREEGFSCSSFDMGNVPDNEQDICCEVGDWFGKGYNYGCTVYASRFVQSRKRPTSWVEFKDWVDRKGGFLSESLEQEVHQLWNYEGNDAYSHGWSRGMEMVGIDSHGAIWEWKNTDFRKSLLESLI